MGALPITQVLHLACQVEWICQEFRHFIMKGNPILTASADFSLVLISQNLSHIPISRQTTGNETG